MVCVWLGGADGGLKDGSKTLCIEASSTTLSGTQASRTALEQSCVERLEKDDISWLPVGRAASLESRAGVVDVER